MKKGIKMKNDVVKFVSFIVQIFYVHFHINKMNTLNKGNKN